jgi:presenilin-like A22 family membrane protease
MFLCAQIIGLYIVDQYMGVEITETGEINVTWENLPSIAGMELERPQVEPSKSIWLIAFAVIIGTVLLLVLIRFKHDVLWRLWFFLAVLICLTIAFGAFFSSIVAFIAALLFAYIKVFRQSFIIQNLTELFVYGGLAAIFVPILDKVSVIILLVLISLYDMYAVWKSKHMIKLAKFQTKARIFAGMLVPYSLPKIRKPKGKKVKKVKKMIKIKTAILGGGDVGFPLLFAGVIMTSVGFWKALIIPVFVSISLLLLLLWGRKDRFYPAMPFLSIGCLAGFGVLSIVEILILLL